LHSSHLRIAGVGGSGGREKAVDLGTMSCKSAIIEDGSTWDENPASSEIIINDPVLTYCIKMNTWAMRIWA